MILAWVAAAQAQPACEPLDLAVLDDGLDRVETAFVDGDERRAASLLGEIHERMPCLVVPATPPAMARHALLQALSSWLDQDRDEALRWARAAHWIDPGHPWPSLVTASHPLRTLVAAEGEAPIGGPEERGLVVPKGGAVLLSGRLATSPRAPVAVPLLAQVVDRDQQVLSASWQDGTAFAPELLGPPAVVPPPRWWSAGPSAGAVRVKAVETLPARRFALVALGGAGSASQEVDRPGDWLAAGRAGSGFGGLGGEARVRLAGPVGAFGDARLALPAGVAPLEGWAGASVRLVGLDLLVGGGFATSVVYEGGAGRPVAVPSPHLGLEGAVPAGAGRVELGAAGGWAPVAAHARGRLAWVGGTDLAFTAGLEGGFTRTAFVQAGTDRELAVAEGWGGLRVGIAIAP